MSIISCYEHIPFEDAALPIRIHFGSHLTPSNSPTGDHFSWHEQLELLHIRQGTLRIRCAEQTWYGEAGDVFLVNPYELHQVSHFQGETVYDCIMIDAAVYRDVWSGSSDARYLELLMDTHACFDNRLSGDSVLLSHIEALCREFQDKRVAYELSVKAHVLGLLVCLLRDHVGQGGTFRRMVDNVERYERIHPVLNYMRSHISEQIRIENLAALCNVSPAHFCRIFRQITGTTPMQYLTSLRLHEAAALLKRTDKNITQIAETVGFEDSGYLSRRFREQFGMTPSQARKQSR